MSRKFPEFAPKNPIISPKLDTLQNLLDIYGNQAKKPILRELHAIL